MKTDVRLLAATLAALAAVSACRKTADLGPADSFLILAPVRDAVGSVVKSPGGLDVMESVEPNDPRAEPVHKELQLGFAAEALRTDYLAKQFVREAEVGGRRYGPAQVAAAGGPTVFVVGGEHVGAQAPGRGLAVKRSFGRAEEHPNLLWVGLPAYPGNDKALAQTLAGLLGMTAAARVATADAPAPAGSLARGYGQALEVIAREWRVGEGPAGAMPAEAGTPRQRELFAAVRENRFAVVTGAAAPGSAPRPAAELLSDPGLAATVIYRLAQSKSVGRKVAPPEVYAPFVKDRVPPGISPAAVLGPFRNFQAKLLSAWGLAVLAGKPPRDIADWVEAYGRAMPAEKLEAARVFVITTYGATVKAGGVPSAADKPGQALAELTALAAEVAAGKLSARAALAP